MLERIAAKYGVQARFIVALWGTETNYGGYTGNFSVPRSLATLAYDGRRAEFFRKELLNALKIIDAGHITLADMDGSWAGAMGQCQFMPTSFLKYAVDYDGDGKKDIWGTRADIFASIANYLSSVGWDPETTWGREVQVPPGFDRKYADYDLKYTIQQWQDAGVRSLGGGDLPLKRGDLQASLVFPGGGDRVVMLYDNYRTILDWNKSSYFATAVGTLSDRIAGW